MKNIDIIAIVIIIIIVIVILFSDYSNKEYEHFKGLKMPSIKNVSTAIKNVGNKAVSTAKKIVTPKKTVTPKKITPVRTTPVRTTPVRITPVRITPVRKVGATIEVTSTALLNKISNIKIQETLVLKSVDSVNKMSITVNNLLNILSRRIPQIPNKIKIANQKKNFTLYLIKKTQTKISYLSTLIIFTTNINSGNSTNISKQVNVLVKKINLLVFAIKTYISRTQSYICQTTNIFFELEENYNNIFDLLNELKFISTRFNSLIIETRKNVQTVNKQFESINLEIQEANKQLYEVSDSATELPDVSADTPSDTPADNTSADNTSTDNTSADNTSIDNTSADVEGFNNVTNVTLFEPIIFEQIEIPIPVTLVLPEKNILPKLNPKELIAPIFNTQNLIELNKFKDIKLKPTVTNSESSEISSDIQIESYILSLIPLEPVVDIPIDVDQSDINAENDLIYELG
jgi:hypothetical protein